MTEAELVAGDGGPATASTNMTRHQTPPKAPHQKQKRRKPLPPMTTAKRKAVSTPKMELPPGFAPLSSKIAIHEASGIVVELSKRRLTDPVTSYFIGRNNSIAIELYKTHRLAYYFITKGEFHPANWVYISDRKVVEELSQLATVVDLKLCSECFLVCWENRERRHGCKENTFLKCHGFGARGDMTSLGHMVITEFPELKGAQKKSVEKLIEEQRMIMENPSPEALKEEELWKEQLKEEWRKAIDQRRDNAKELYKKRKEEDKADQSGEETDDEDLIREQPPSNTSKTTTTNNRFQSMSIPDSDVTKEPVHLTNELLEPSLAELTTTLKSFITTIISSRHPGLASDLKSTVDEYIRDPHISTTVLPFILLDTITDDLWSSSATISNTLRFRLDAKNMKYVVYDEKKQRPLSICLLNNGGDNGWRVEVCEDGNSESRFSKEDLSFDAVCQFLVVFRALVYTFLSVISGGETVPSVSTTSMLITTVFEAMPCDSDEAVRVIKEKLCSHISR